MIKIFTVPFTCHVFKFILIIYLSNYSCPPFKEESKFHEDNIPNAITSRPDFDCGSPTYNYRVVECKLTTTDEIGRSAPATASVHKISDRQTRPNTVSITIPDEGKG